MVSLCEQVDIDGSGLISFAEFTRMVRHELRLSTRQLADRALRGVWLGLDADGSGHITAGEFGKFMRRSAKLGAASMHQRSRALDWHNAEPAANSTFSMRAALRARANRIARYEREVAILEDQLGGSPGGGSPGEGSPGGGANFASDGVDEKHAASCPYLLSHLRGIGACNSPGSSPSRR